MMDVTLESREGRKGVAARDLSFTFEGRSGRRTKFNMRIGNITSEN